MKFKVFYENWKEKSTKEGRYPDLHYEKPSSSVWIFIPPSALYWWNPKKKFIMLNAKPHIALKDFYRYGKKGGLYTNYDKGYFVDSWKSGGATHLDLSAVLRGSGIRMDSHRSEHVVAGRSLKGNHQAWALDTPRHERLREKAMDLAYRYIK